MTFAEVRKMAGLPLRPVAKAAGISHEQLRILEGQDGRGLPVETRVRLLHAIQFVCSSERLRYEEMERRCTATIKHLLSKTGQLAGPQQF